MSILERYHL